MMAYAEGFAGPRADGVILSVAAAIGAALYKVKSGMALGFRAQGNIARDSLVPRPNRTYPAGRAACLRLGTEMFSARFPDQLNR